jgi:hypothetical protein
LLARRVLPVLAINQNQMGARANNGKATQKKQNKYKTKQKKNSGSMQQFVIVIYCKPNASMTRGRLQQRGGNFFKIIIFFFSFIFFYSAQRGRFELARLCLHVGNVGGGIFGGGGIFQIFHVHRGFEDEVPDFREL